MQMKVFSKKLTSLKIELLIITLFNNFSLFFIQYLSNNWISTWQIKFVSNLQTDKIHLIKVKL